jgi:hypothetical protein
VNPIPTLFAQAVSAPLFLVVPVDRRVQFKLARRGGGLCLHDATNGRLR